MDLGVFSHHPNWTIVNGVSLVLFERNHMSSYNGDVS